MFELSNIRGGGVEPGLPAALRLPVLEALRRAGDDSPVRRLEAVKSGAESRALRLVTRRGAYFLKWSDRLGPGRYRTEVHGLALLSESGAVRAPRVLAVQDGGAGGASAPGFLLLEWLDRPGGEAYLKRVGAGLGRQVAALHRCATFWGRATPGYAADDGLAAVGRWRESGWAADWATFYRDRRLGPGVAAAARAGRLEGARLARLERILARLDDWLGGLPRHPSLLHGDLHRGNVLCDRAGTAVLVDPHPSFGEREFELSYLELYGRFPPAFFAAYREAWPLPPGYEERRGLYQLHHFLRGVEFGHAGAAGNLDVVAYRYAGA
jgi:fructosamine-3-kinase